MKTGSLNVLRSPAICWSLCGLFAFLIVIWQLVDVVPYPNRYRDYVLGTVAFGGGTILFFLLARRAGKKARHKAPDDRKAA
jgi:hypothetical protein